MKKIVFAFLWGVATLEAISQNTQPSLNDTLKMSLQECIDFALKNNVNVKNASLDEEIAAARVREVRGIGLPQINGSVGLQHYFKLRNSYFGGNSPFAPRETIINQVPNANDPTKTVDIVTQGNPTIPADAIIVYPNIFQLPSTLDANITASQILFNASYLVGLQAAKTYKELSQRSATVSKQQTAVNVKKAYYQQQISYERIKLFDISIVRLDTTIKQMRAMLQNGFVERIDLDRLEVSYNNLLTEYEKSLNFLILSSLSLKYQMGMPLEQNLLLTDSLTKFISDTSFKSTVEYNLNDRPEYLLLKAQKKASELDLKNNRAAALPSLSLSATLGAFSSVKGMDFFSTKQFYLVDGNKSVYQSNYWSNYSFLQAGLNVPIFSGLQRSSKVQQSKLSLKKSENSLKNFEQTIDLQVKSAKVNLTNSYRTLIIQQRNMDLAKRVSSVTFKKYKAGTGSNLEVTTAESSSKEAQVNYFNALYDFLVYKIDLEQAAGLIKY